MSFLLDTQVLSEVTKKKPNQEVIDWFSRTEDRTLFMSVLSIGEIGKGVESLPPSEKKEHLSRWLEQDLPEWFEDRILPIDRKVCEVWGRMLSRQGRSMPAVDSLLAATALCHGLIVVTRNTRDFDYSQLEILNPWNGGT